MSRPIIEVRGLSKKYKIGKKESYLTLRDSLSYWLRQPLKVLMGREKSVNSADEFYALSDVSFNVGRGELVGIIGRNGAGKTTLLKILSRITYPSKGEIRLRGHVASLLEVGTGFHLELTGRENIYFNGSILGMKKREIDRKFDEIVAFSEVERFIDTPVKRYSSGMGLRLAFAVAAHLEPEILLIDEVLAVGDLMFQKKCLGKMDDIAKTGRTVLFVSHNLDTIQRLCQRAILLHEGKIVEDGLTAHVITRYMKNNLDEAAEKIWHEAEKAPGNEVVKMHAVRIKNRHGKVSKEFDVRDPITIELGYWVLQDGHLLDAAISLVNERGYTILSSLDNLDSPWTGKSRPPGLYWSICQIPGDFLNNGQISLLAGIVTNPHPVHVLINDVLRFEIKDAMDPEGVRGNYPREWPPVAVRPRLHWKVERLAGNGKVST